MINIHTQDQSELELKNQVNEAVSKYFRFKHQGNKGFAPGDRIPYAGRIFNEKEVLNLVDSALEFWLTSGKYTNMFEKALAEFLGVKYCSVTNSGSSANLLAFMALTSPRLGDKRIKKGG